MPVAFSSSQYHEPPRTILLWWPGHSLAPPPHGPLGSTPSQSAPHFAQLPPYQSSTHSHELPTMSKRPYTPAGREPTSHGRPVSGLLNCFFSPQPRPDASR